MRSTLVLPLLLVAVGCASRLVSAEDGADQLVEATTGQPVHDEQPSEAPRQLDFAEQENQLMKRYAHLLDEPQQEPARAGPPAKKAHWLMSLFGLGRRANSLRDDYLKIDAELKRRLPDDATPEKNFDEVLKWYLADGKGEALGQLAALVHLTTDEGKCNERALDILEPNERATQGAGSADRVAAIVRFFIAHHQSECMPVYKRRFLQIKDNNRGDSFAKLLEAFPDGYIAQMSRDHPDMLTDLMLSKEDFAVGEPFERARARLTQHVLDHLRNIGLRKKSNNFVEEAGKVNEAKLKSLANEYVVDPCKKYVARLGPDVFRPFAFDLGAGEPILDQKPDFDFWFGLSRFEICQVVLKDGKSFQANLLKLAQEPPAEQ